MQIRNNEANKVAVEKLVKLATEQIAEAEVMQAFYIDKAANEKSKEKQAHYALKENQVRDSIKFNVEFLDFIDHYKFD
jgi:ribosomal protein L19